MHLQHAGGRRTAARPGDEGFNRAGLALDERLDGPIQAVAHPPGDAKALGLAAKRFPVADALNASGDAQVADEHGEHDILEQQAMATKEGEKEMRIALLGFAALAFIGFVVVAYVLPGMAQASAREAAQALIAGAASAKQQVGAAALTRGQLVGSGKAVKLPARQDAKHGELKWVVSENGAIRGWNENNALEIELNPSLHAGKVGWTCRGYPVTAMPAGCGGR